MQRMKMHPDLGGDHWQASLINEAFATLSDPDKRAVYDRDLPVPVAAQRNGATAEPPPAKQSSQTDWSLATGRFCAFCGTPHRNNDRPDQNCARCDSPLTMPAATEDAFSLQRQIERMPSSFPVVIYPDWQGSSDNGTAVDLSPGGMCFSSAVALPIGKIIKIDSEPCTAIAQVRHCSASAGRGRCETGVQFVTLRFNNTQGNFVSVSA